MYDPDDRHDVRRAPVSVSARPRHGGWGHCPKNLVGCSKVHLLASCFLAGEFGLPSVFKNAYFTFFSDLKNMTLLFWNDVSKSRKSHTKLSSLLNVYRNFDLKTPECYGYLTTHRHFSHTVLSCIVSCVRTFEQDVWCFYVFSCFLNPKKHDFLRFLSCCTRFLELWLPWL